jgi:hypothetical protein
MALETTITSITEIVPAEMISDVIMLEARDQMVVAPLCHAVRLPEGSGKVYNFPALEKDVGEDITTEGTTTLSNVELTFTETSVTVAQVGILRETTKFAERTNRLGAGGLLSLDIGHAARALAEMVDDDLCAHFANITDSVGATGVDLSVANILEAIAKQRTNCANGRLVFVLDDQQQSDLMQAVGASGAMLFNGANQNIVNARVDGYMGDFVGADFYYTNLTDSTGGTDVIGACLVDGSSNPGRASLGLVTLWTAEREEIKDIAKVTTKRAWTSAYGTGLIGDLYSVKIVTDL